MDSKPQSTVEQTSRYVLFESESLEVPPNAGIQVKVMMSHETPSAAVEPKRNSGVLPEASCPESPTAENSLHSDEKRMAPPKSLPAATPYQIDHMVNYLERHPHLATRRFQTPDAACDSSASWENLAEELNALWKNGPPKDAKTWRTAWHTQKKLVMRKIRKSRQKKSGSRNSGVHTVQLSSRDRKILSLMDLNDDEEGRQAILDTIRVESPSTEKSPASRAENAASEVSSNFLESPSTVDQDVQTIHSNTELLDILGGFSDSELALMMLRQSPRVKIPALTLSEVEAIISSRPGDSASQQPSSSSTPNHEEAAEPRTVALKRRNLTFGPVEVTAVAPSEPCESSNQQEWSGADEALLEAACSSPEPDRHSSSCRDSFSEAPKASELGKLSEPNENSSVQRPKMMTRATSSPKVLSRTSANRMLIRQLRDARKDLVGLTMRQNSCMQMFAKTMQQIAEHDKRRDEMLLTLLENHKAQYENNTQMALSIVKECFQLLREKN